MNDLKIDYRHHTAELPGIGGVYKKRPSDFVVEEVPAYEPSGEGEHVYVWVQKRDVSSGELIRRIAERAGVRRRKIGMAGNKDRQAITRQWLSIHDHDLQPDSLVGPIDDQVEILRATRHRNKLKTGHLRGNRFITVIRDLAVDPDEARTRAEAILEVLRVDGVPNFFGEQRFGHDLSTLKMGLRMLAGDTPGQLRRDRRLKRLAASAVQSAAFNRVLATRMDRGTTHEALPGDRLNRRHERGQLVVEPENRAEAQAAIDRGELIPTGPMWGPRMYDTYDVVRELEEAALAAFDVVPEDFEPFSKIAAGTRRDLFVAFLEPPSVELEDDGGIQIGFSLPSGTYATIVLDELIKVDSAVSEVT